MEKQSPMRQAEIRRTPSRPRSAYHHPRHSHHLRYCHYRRDNLMMGLVPGQLTCEKMISLFSSSAY